MTPRSRFVCIALLLLAHSVSGGVYQRTKDGKTLVWNNYPGPNDRAVWSGKRDAQGYAIGNGTLTWYTTSEKFQTGSHLPASRHAVVVSRYTGKMVRGKLDGAVLNVESDGKQRQLKFVNGIKVQDRLAAVAMSDQRDDERLYATDAIAPASSPSPTEKTAPKADQPKKRSPEKMEEAPAEGPPEPKVDPSPSPEKPTLEIASLKPSGPAAAPPTSDEIDSVVKDRIIADFKDETQSVLSQVAEATGNFHGVDRLDSVGKLPTPVSENVSSLVQRARDFRSKVGYEIALRDYKTETETVDALAAIDQVIKNIAGNDSAAANAKLTEFLKSNPEPGADAQKGLWQYLTSIQQLCSRSEKDAEVHLHRAESFAAASRSSEAIREYQEAYRIFPNPATAEKIRQLQANSLGL